MRDKICFDIVSYLMGRNSMYQKMLDLYPTDTIENTSIAKFPDGADDIPVKEMSILITPTQLGSDAPSAENVRPIFGARRLRVYESQELAIGRQTVESTCSDGGFVYFSVDAIGEGLSYVWEFKSPDASTWTTSTLTGPIVSPQMRAERDGREYRCTITDSGGHTIRSDNMVMRLGTTASVVFENGDVPYVEIDLPAIAGTVYGGTLDVTTGLLTITHAIINLGNLKWMLASAAYHTFYTEELVSVISAPAAGETVDGMCDKLKLIAAGTSAANYENYNLCVGSNARLNVRLTEDYSSQSDEAVVKTVLNGTNFVYPLATPTIVQLTPAIVKTLYGDNLIAVFGDDGLVSAEQTIASLIYRADVEKYIEKKLNP